MPLRNRRPTQNREHQTHPQGCANTGLFSNFIFRACLVATLLFNLGLAAHYVTVEYEAYIHSDSAVKNLLAREIFLHGTYFPADWNYVNGDLWVLFGQTYIIPLLFHFKNDFYLHATSGLASTFLILASTYLVMHLITNSIWIKLTAVAVVAAGISGLTAENLYGQVSYGYVYYLSCLILFACWKFLEEEASRRKLAAWGIFIFGLFLLTFLSNPQRAAPSFALPAIGATIVTMASTSRRATLFGIAHPAYDRRPRQILLIAVIITGAILGSALHAATMDRVNDIRGVGHATWLNYPDIARNFTLVISQMLAVFDAIPPTGGMVFGWSGIYEAIRLSSGLAILGLMPIAVLSGLHSSRPSAVFFHASAALVIGAFLFLQVTTSVPDMRDPVQAARYLIPPLMLGLLAVISQAQDFKRKATKAIAIVVIFIFATSGYRALRGSDPSNTVDFNQSRKHILERRAIIEFFKQNDLRYGYASYWNSGIFTVLSGEDVKIRQVNFSEGMPHPMRHLSSDAWYRPAAWSGASFILLTEAESSQVDLAVLARYHLTPSKRIKFKEWVIYVFEENISRRLPGWDLTYTFPSWFLVNPATLHSTGTYLNHGSPRISITHGDVGFLQYGPYISAPPGKYVAEFELEIKGVSAAPESKIVLDVASKNGNNIYASIALAKTGKLRQKLPFEIESRALDLELRVFTTGGVDATLYSTKISKVEFTQAQN